VYLSIQVEPELVKISHLLNQAPRDGLTLSTANRLFIDSHFKLLEPYLAETHRIFQAEPENVPFASDSNKAVQRINAWVNEKTNGKIDKLFEELDANTKLVIANAIYFKVNDSF